MDTRRLEAFSDGVMAVVITIMVIELHPPTGHSFHDLRPLVPKLLVYLLSFVFVAIYWNNHHNLMQVVDRVSGGVLWANAHLLFWLSLTPVAAAWLGPHLGDSAPAAAYGFVLLGSAIAYTILVRSLLKVNGPNSLLALAIGGDRKGWLSLVAYVVAIALAPAVPWLSLGVYVAVAAAWLVPDRRMERVLPDAAVEPE
jgi:TMEM175 potassium channel family protein